jgi:hypothetical protein
VGARHIDRGVVSLSLVDSADDLRSGEVSGFGFQVLAF